VVFTRRKSTGGSTCLWRDQNGGGNLLYRNVAEALNPIHDTSADLTIGANGQGANRTFGAIDDVCIWPRLLSPGEQLAFVEGQKPD